jgi:hypothetical protein
MRDQNVSEGQSGILQEPRGWRRALVHAMAVSLLVLGLFYYWFAIADRFFVFLYYHDMGPVVPDTSPFSPVTSSRYWMAGLVASGVVLVLYVMINWLLGRLAASYRTPAWWRVWLLSAVPLLVGIPAITMTVNQPTLPLSNAAQATLATLAGLSLALLPGERAAKHPGELVWLAFDGWGLMLVLTALVGVQNLPRWLASGGVWWVLMLAGTVLAGVVWLLAVTVLHAQFSARSGVRAPVPRATTVLLAGASVTYLLMPLVHHLFGTNGYLYITNSNNFFADNIALQIAVWLVAAGLVWAITRVREALPMRRRDLEGIGRPAGS